MIQRSHSRLRFRELDASKSGLAELTRFYRSAYVGEFPDADERESLANMKRYLVLKEQGFYGKNNYHIVVAELDGQLVGGAVSDYLAVPNAGVIEFLFTTRAARGQGLGRALLQETERLLRRDAKSRVHRVLRAIVAEMNDPFRRPATSDNMDPFARAMIWAGWGFGKLEFPYVQPALSSEQAAVGGLVLIAKPIAPSRVESVQAEWVRDVVGEYMTWAMRIAKPEQNAEFRTMARWLAARERVALTPLDRYVGRDPKQVFAVSPVSSRGPLLRATAKLIRDEVRGQGRVESNEGFMRALARGKPRYHLWALSRSDAQSPEGAASFFTLPSLGFGGYLVLAGRLRGRGLLRGLIARIEEQMLRDNARAERWWIEVGPESVAQLMRVGFKEVELDYRPPRVGSARARRAQPERLRLMYKVFGSDYGELPITRRQALSAIAAILKHVYRVQDVRNHPCYERARLTSIVE